MGNIEKDFKYNRDTPNYGNLENESFEDYNIKDEINYGDLESEAKSEVENKDEYTLDLKDEKMEQLTILPQSNSLTENKRRKVISQIKPLDESTSILNSYIELIPNYDRNYWARLLEEQEENTIDNKVNTKKLYKYGVINNLLDCSTKFNWKFANDAGTLRLYNGKSWIKVEENSIKLFLQNVSLQLGLPEWLAIDNKFTDEIYYQLLSTDFFLKISPDNSSLLNLENGTLKIDQYGINLLNFSSNNYLTYQLNFKYCPYEKNSLFLAFINKVLPDKDTQKTLQQALGYFLTQDLKLEKSVFLFGLGSNGKSVIFEILNGLFGDNLISNISLSDLLNKKSYERADINHKLINYSSDDSLKKLDHGKFKQLVSGEPMVVRQIYGKPFTMKRYAKLIFNVNRIDDADVESTIGFFRRMVFIPFEQTIQKEEQDKLLHKKILENKAGVLNWIIEGTLEVIKHKEIFISKKCLNFLETFRQESNIVIRFAQEYHLNISTTETISFQSLYERFISFCKKEGEKTITKRHFNNELKKLNFNSSRHSSGMVWNLKMN